MNRSHSSLNLCRPQGLAQISSNRKLLIEPNASDHHQLAQSLLCDHPLLGERIALSCEVPQPAVPEILTEVLRFLSLVVSASGTLTPSHRLDCAWHEFLLFTRAYSSYCEDQFGRYVHHDPGGRQNHAQYRAALKLYTEQFGLPDPRFWAEDADCGACESTQE